MKEFPIPYALTNCHNSLCAVGGTINEDDHMFGLSAAKKYGGIYVPANQSVIHSYAREELARCGGMILGSDSHTRYGALGTMAVGEGGPELAKQLLKNTWDVNMPKVVLVYLTGAPRRGIGPHDVAIALVKATFESGFVNNCVLEFAGPGIKSLPIDFRNGIDVMTTETTCLSSIWETDETTRGFFAAHGREQDYTELHPGKTAWYDKLITIDLSKVESMIALPFHPSNAWTIHEFLDNAEEILAQVEQDAKRRFPKAHPHLTDKVRDGGVWADQGVIAGCSGGLFDNITEAADIIRGKYTGSGAFSFDVYPTSVPGVARADAHRRDGGAARVRRDHQAELLRPLLRRGRCARQQRPVPAPHDAQLPEPRGLQARRGAVCGRVPDGRALHRRHGGKRRPHHRRDGRGLHPRATTHYHFDKCRLRQPCVLRLRQGRPLGRACHGPEHHRLAQNVPAE